VASVASRPRALPRPASFPTGAAAIAAAAFALLVLSLVLRTRALGSSLWMDEGLSIGIASQHFFDIPGILRQDGSPPLYYLLLNLWMNAFGHGPGETQGLSVAVAVLMVPAGLWAGWTLFGRRAGLFAAALAAVNPWITVYAEETRMYALMMLLSLVITAAFVHVFVYRRRGYLPLFIVTLALMIYTHNWGLFVAAGLLCGLGVVLLEEHEGRRQLLRDGAIAFGVAGLLYLPWLPTLAYQVQHTGAPWLNPPRFGAPVQISKSLLGGGAATVALVLGAGSGLADSLRRRVSDDRERWAVVGLSTVFVGTLLVAWLFSQVSPAWTTRYLGVSLGPLILLSALGLARARNLGMAALAIVFVIWAVPHNYDLKHKSNAADLASAAVPILKPHDVVVSIQPEQAPLIAYHLTTLRGERGLRFATPMGPVANQHVMDWRDGEDRLDSATPTRNLQPLLATLPRGGHVLLVHPVTTKQDDWDAPWTQTVRRRSAQWGAFMEADKHFRRLAVVPDFYKRATRIGVRGVLYEKTS
jgi:mannosyltransferase